MTEIIFDASKEKVSGLLLTVARYRQGQITVRIDFKRNILIWKDSNRWFNDFVRSLTEQQTTEIIQTLPNLLKNCKVPDSFVPDPEADYCWTLQVTSLDETADAEDIVFKCAGVNNESEDFDIFISKIESVTEQIIDPIGGH